MILNNNATIVKVKSKMSNVPGNIFNPCAISMIEPEMSGTSNQTLAFLYWEPHINNAEVKE